MLYKDPVALPVQIIIVTRHKFALTDHKQEFRVGLLHALFDRIVPVSERIVLTTAGEDVAFLGQSSRIERFARSGVRKHC
jgi:hypothetical protein